MTSGSIRPTQNRIGPSYGGQPSTSDLARPSVAVRPVQSQAPQVTSNAQGLAQLSNAFGNFFGGAQRLLERHQQQELQLQLQQIDQENKDLGEMAKADMLAGATKRPEFSDRRAYVESYDRSEALVRAQDFAQQYHNRLADAPKDGSVDPMAIHQELQDEFFGKGTGNAVFDAEFLTQSKRMTDHSLGQFRDVTRQTMQSNVVESWRQGVVGRFSSEIPIDPEDAMLDLAKAISLARGDTAKGAELLASTYAAAVDNPVQAGKALQAFEQAGLDQQYPELYQTLSEKFAKNIQHPATLKAVQVWAGLNDKLMAAVTNPASTLDDLLNLHVQGTEAFYAHGGLTHLEHMNSTLMRELEQRASKIANVNQVYLTATSPGTTLASNMMAHGVNKSAQEQVDKDFFPFINVMAQEQVDFPARFPGLAQSRRPDGTYAFLDSVPASRDMARLLTSSNQMVAALGGLLPSQVRTEVLTGLRDHGNPAKADASFQFLKELEARAPSRHQFVEAVKDQDMVALYDVVKDATAMGGKTPQDVFKAMRDNPALPELMKKVRSGNVPWQEVTGDYMRSTSEIEQDVQKRIHEAARGWIDTRPWYKFWGGEQVTLPWGDAAKQIKARVVQVMGHQIAATGAADLDKAIRLATDQASDKFIPLPGAPGRLTLVQDPFNGAGRKISSPLASYNGVDVYAPFPMLNGRGQEENPLDNYRESADALVKLFPTTKAESASDLALTPDNLKSKGLFVVSGADGVPLRFTPGSKFAGHWDPKLTNPLNQAAGLVIPKDPREAARFIQSHLPKGFQIEPDEMSGRVAFRLLYGFHLKEGRDAERKWATDAAKANEQRERAPVPALAAGAPR